MNPRESQGETLPPTDEPGPDGIVDEGTTQTSGVTDRDPGSDADAPTLTSTDVGSDADAPTLTSTDATADVVSRGGLSTSADADFDVDAGDDDASTRATGG